MSDGNQVARIALVAAGAYFGPIGAQVGAIAGQLLFPGELPDIEGPRLLDRRITTSTLGSPINRLHGTFRTSGNVIWSRGIDETAHERKVGKGGPTQVETSYTYSSSFAVSLCEGEVTGVRRIWADGVLIFDVGESASATQVLVSNQSGVTIYNGSETQTPNSAIQSDVGVDNASANRGICYLVFNNLQLEKYGNRIPSITAEVLTLGSVDWVFKKYNISEPNYAYYDNGAMDTLVHWDGIVAHWVRAPYTDSTHQYINVTEYSIAPDGVEIPIRSYISPSSYTGTVQWPVYPGRSNQKKYLLEKDNEDGGLSLYLVDFDGGFSIPVSGSLIPGAGHPAGKFLGAYNGVGDQGHPYWADYNGLTVVAYDTVAQYTSIKIYVADNGYTDTGIDVDSDLNVSSKYSSPAQIRLSSKYLFVTSSSDHKKILKYDIFDFSLIDIFDLGDTVITFDVIGDDDIVIAASGHIRRYHWGNPAPYDNLYGGSNPDTSVGSSGASQYKHHLVFSEDGNSYAHEYSYWLYKTKMTYGYKDLASDKAALSLVITKICQTSGVSPSDIDVSTITDEVQGYLIDAPMSGRKALEPLLNTYNLTAYESDWKIKFKKIESETPEAIDSILLGANEDKSEQELIPTKIGDTSNLPRRFIVQYSDFDRDYIINSQKAQRIIK